MENEVKLSDPKWWNAHITPKNAEWIAENVKGVDHHIKEMLLLVEQEGDMSVEDVNISHLDKDGLIAHIKEISDRHHSLADCYSTLTDQLRSCIQSGNGIQRFEGTLPGVQTPIMKQGVNIVQGQLVGLDSSPSSSNGISDASSNAYSGPSSLSSDSDSETFYASPGDRLTTPSYGKVLKHKPMPAEPVLMTQVDMLTKHGDTDGMKSLEEEREDYEMLLRQIAEYEEKLKSSNQKLQLAEEEIAKLKSELQENEAVILKMDNLEAQLVSAENHIKSYEAHLDKENKKSLLLQSEIVELEAKVESEKRQVLDLQETVSNYKAELSVREHEIQKLSTEIHDASGSFALEKWELESCISKLTDRLTFHVAKNEELQIEFESLTEELQKCEAGAIQMERKQEAREMKWLKDVECARVEVQRKNELIDTLNQNLDELKQKHDMIISEKDEANAKLQTVSAELGACNNQIQQLRSENKQLSTFCENEDNRKDQLKLRIGELEKELEQQTVAILEIAEEKREAIRQLCFSLDHFKGAYEEIRGFYVAQKRPRAVV